MKQQNNNKRNTPFFEFNGHIKTMSQWAEVLEIGRSIIAQRYYGYKWPIQKALGGGV